MASGLPPDRLKDEFAYVSTRILSIIDRKLARQQQQPDAPGGVKADIVFYKMCVSLWGRLPHVCLALCMMRLARGEVSVGLPWLVAGCPRDRCRPTALALKHSIPYRHISPVPRDRSSCPYPPLPLYRHTRPLSPTLSSPTLFPQERRLPPLSRPVRSGGSRRRGSGVAFPRDQGSGDGLRPVGLQNR